MQLRDGNKTNYGLSSPLRYKSTEMQYLSVVRMTRSLTFSANVSREMVYMFDVMFHQTYKHLKYCIAHLKHYAKKKEEFQSKCFFTLNYYH